MQGKTGATAPGTAPPVMTATTPAMQGKTLTIVPMTATAIPMVPAMPVKTIPTVRMTAPVMTQPSARAKIYQPIPAIAAIIPRMQPISLILVL